MNSKRILLRLSDDGEPISNTADNTGANTGVLILPSVPLPPNYTPGDVIFQLDLVMNAASRVSKNGTVYSNVTDGTVPFVRDSYRQFPIECSFHKDIRVSIPIYKSGVYNFYIGFEDPEGQPQSTKKFYFNVPPNLRIKDSFVAFNSINIQSVVSKWIGPLSDWDAFFGEVSYKGYNMIHFTPLQERGESNSPYSILDQLKFDPGLFESNAQAVKFIGDLMEKYSLMSLTDVVLNHTANNSPWLADHPDAGYNEVTAPHLRAAIELELKLFEYSDNLKKLGLPTEIKSGADLDAIMEGVQANVFVPLNLWQFFVFDKQKVLSDINDFYQNGEVEPVAIPGDVDINNLKQLSQYVLKICNKNASVVLEDRFSNQLDAAKFLGILSSLFDNKIGDIEFNTLENKASSIVDEINLDLYAAYDADVTTIKNSVKDRIRYLRLDSGGPQLGEITSDSALIENYFTKVTNPDGQVFHLANNGWIWGGNPLVDFASSDSKAYLRREVIVWSDCVKLRYGEGPEDSPYLWERMTKYTEQCARVFNGFRIDNCHSTPLHVGEALLDAARNVNPDLYVVAELFSGSEEMDKIFVEKLGLNSLIREAMQAWNVAELSRLVHKHGGRPLGSFTWLPLDEYAYPATEEPKDSKLPIPRVLTNVSPHALFMDCTHDNETPAQKRSVEDTLPNAALVAFCSSAIGSVFGYDEGYPELLDVVGEERQYKYVPDQGIRDVKKKLHHIRNLLAGESEDILQDHEMYIHHEGEYITIQRHNARTGKGWFLIARTKFGEGDSHQVLDPVRLVQTKVKLEFAHSLSKTGDYEKDSKYLTAIPTKLQSLEMPAIEYEGDTSIIKVTDDFIPGSIAVYSTYIPGVDIKLDEFVKTGGIASTIDLDLYDLNAILYRCEPEERDFSGGQEGTYSIPNYGNLVYSGFEGWISVLKKVIWQNELAHPISDHLRDGTWALDYVVNRLDKYATNSKGLGKFLDWLRSRVDAIRDVPYFLRPHFFALVVGTAYEACRFRSFRLLSSQIQGATNFVQSLALTSIQMVGKMNNTSLFPFEQIPCLAAGLPHFSNDYMRCWGRDVFISFRGLLIVAERHEDAKRHILGFAKTLKHGLIPNLLDAGRNPRYNARDAAWFFLQAIQDYIKEVPNGIEILDEKVSRRFPLDDTYVTYDDPVAFSYESTIREVIFEILQRHAKGIKYREANAGPNLDSQMKDIGFNVEINVDWSNGLIFGGQQFNCGTWMDKMGESTLAGNKGYPGTPRDGAAVEIQGLLKSALRFVNELGDKFSYDKVERADGSSITFKEWEDLVQSNFERCFFVPTSADDDQKYDIDPSIVNRRGIYKDLYRSGKPYEDYQLRPNFAIAMTVAPELFDAGRGYSAIKQADQIIRGPVGMRTLDPSDWNYRPDYYNSVDSTDFATAKGRNYHQGPEWVWCFGYFMRAYLKFTYKKVADEQVLFGDLNQKIQGHIKWIRESDWAGLTELTNKDGELCGDSSPSQAWSTSCLLDLYYDLWKRHYRVFDIA
ncbi:bifunctional 4-alpha-glucanotransferase/amylo-alpha-1,6-glucosidase [Yamadazyma tenuis]|uniref:Glycogen debranching enzyme n=1 Tax=Candida tenuis (strain ATCC 10573 / BCRC 21748 / CBS 615 / JCM 9827 / NBRC 10315 / NRRL Y-1498 / VKM Y-70) TaxID=590646 RepID=G3B7R1_CANTC|nr:glycogen debranching enzyme [Yamadazyma tenuis ATCC 10573]EGV62299.1 glycogen debranching enzyme [Yamadazyma tenuis ATCC 10573]WEJ93555.1 bifunctional 4-alpha-glucanotransferase/amylo-alpha-1,6-glucosidase [Yamadazyma tenuis]